MAQGCKIPIGMEQALRGQGVAPAEVLAAAGLPSRILDPAGQRVSVPDYFALWRAIRQVSGRADIGLALAGSVTPDLTEPLFLAILSAPSVSAALQVVSTYKRLLSPEDVVVHVEASRGSVVLAYEWPDPGVPQVLLDAELGFILEMCRRGTRRPELRPIEVRLRAAALEPGSGHAERFACPIRLGAPADTLELSAEDAARPFLTSNPQLLDALVPHLEAGLPAAPTSEIARVRSVIAERLRGQRPAAQVVAKQLAMSTRSLQRLLKEHGTSFRAVLDQVRSEHARGYLSSTAFSDSEISFLLGFEDPNSFYRAFRSWSGMSPSEFRRRPEG